jgi:hypothetical protein
MSLQSLPENETARPTFFPRAPGPRPEPPTPPPSESTRVTGPSGARAASRRRLLAGLTGGSLSPLTTPQRAPHRDPVLALVQRITQGFNLAEFQRASALGYEAYLEEQLDHLAIDDADMDERLQFFPTLDMSPKELYDTYISEFSTPFFELKGAALLRAVHSKRQLFERMVEFWNDHFCIDQSKSNLEWVFLPEHDRDVIRANALGSFPKMLSACAHGGAMLFYLDNWLNVAGEVQENYARELLELHTLGVHGGYNEFDVTEVAKCLTGWTLNPDQNSPDWLRSTFDGRQHTGGKKFVLGNVITSAPHAATLDGNSTGRHDAQKVIDIITVHPSTASFLARKMIRWLLTPAPPQSLVDQVAETYLATNGDIKAMLRVILARENMGWSSPVLDPKFRRPFHYMTSLLRAFDADVTNPLGSLLFYLPGMGHMPFDHAQPDGYPDTVHHWGTSLLPRWAFSAVFLKPGSGVSHSIPGVRLPGYPLLKAKLEYFSDADRPGLASRMNERIFGSTLTPHEIEVLQQYIDQYSGVFEINAMFDCLSLGASLPGFQWC